MDKLKIIKTVVVLITFMLVFGSLMLLTVIYKKAHTMPTVYTENDLDQPLGSRIDSMIEIDGKLAILVKDGGLADRIIFYHPQSMQKISAITLQGNNHE